MNPKIFFHPERCMLCLSCVLACQMNSQDISDFRKIPREQKPSHRISVAFARGTPWVWKCQHCVSAPCIEACVSGSLCHEEGRVVHHSETCVGCGSCLLVCPNSAPTYDVKEERIVKCDLCSDDGVPSCVKACQNRALVYQESNLFARDKKKRFARELVSCATERCSP
jgi:anaerobic carbon-monoxide dehydrogenase iron sulfur subunit